MSKLFFIKQTALDKKFPDDIPQIDITLESVDVDINNKKQMWETILKIETEYHVNELSFYSVCRAIQNRNENKKGCPWVPDLETQLARLEFGVDNPEYDNVFEYMENKQKEEA